MHSSGPGRTRATRGSTLEIASQSNAPGKGAGADKVASRAAPETGATRERARSQENETNDGKHAAGQQGRAMKQPTKSFTDGAAEKRPTRASLKPATDAPAQQDAASKASSSKGAAPASRPTRQAAVGQPVKAPAGATVTQHAARKTAHKPGAVPQDTSSSDDGSTDVDNDGDVDQDQGQQKTQGRGKHTASAAAEQRGAGSLHGQGGGRERRAQSLSQPMERATRSTAAGSSEARGKTAGRGKAVAAKRQEGHISDSDEGSSSSGTSSDGEAEQEQTTRGQEAGPSGGRGRAGRGGSGQRGVEEVQAAPHTTRGAGQGWGAGGSRQRGKQVEDISIHAQQPSAAPAVAQARGSRALPQRSSKAAEATLSSKKQQAQQIQQDEEESSSDGEDDAGMGGTHSHAQFLQDHTLKAAEDAASEDEDEGMLEADADVDAGAATGGSGAYGAGGGGCKRKLMELLDGRLGDDHLHKVLRADLAKYAKHANAKQRLLADYRAQFDEWRVFMGEQFSLLFYGLGSKRCVLDAFARECLSANTRAAVMLVDGFDPRCSVKDIILSAAQALLQRTIPKPVDPQRVIADIAAEPLDRHLYIVIHNIEGTGIRGDVALLSELAACPQVHIAASTDHVMTAQLFDSRAFGLFRWRAMNIPTFQPHMRELADVPGILGTLTAATAKRSAGTALRSLVQGAQEVFRLLAEQQLEQAADEHVAAEGLGLTFQLLFRMCRERFLANNEGTLRQHLVEFRDHHLVAEREEGGTLLLYIPLSIEEIKAVLSDLDSARAADAALLG